VQLLPHRAPDVDHGDLHDRACGAKLIVVKIVVEREAG
jgi:hypothetical protein